MGVTAGLHLLEELVGLATADHTKTDQALSLAAEAVRSGRVTRENASQAIAKARTALERADAREAIAWALLAMETARVGKWILELALALETLGHAAASASMTEQAIDAFNDAADLFDLAGDTEQADEARSILAATKAL